MYDVICYGGPKHGQRLTVKHPRFYVAVSPPLVKSFDDYDLLARTFETVAYRVALIHDVKGGPYGRRAERLAYAAVAEGYQMTRREMQELVNDVPWRWETSILDDFDGWWRWQLYKRGISKEQEIIDNHGPWYDA